MALREQIGAAVNARSLVAEDSDGSIRHVDRVAALGLAGGQRPRTRLAELLWRIRYGADHRSVHTAALVFAWWLRQHREVRTRWHVREHSDLLLDFARLVLLEWQHERCAACGGEGTVPHAPDRANPRGWRTHCHDCTGTGRCRTDHGARVQGLHLTHEVYDKHWRKRFDQAHLWLDDMEPEIAAGLQRRLARSTLPAS